MSIELADFKTLAARRDGGVLHVTLNRPEVRNAMSLAMVRELRTVLGQAEMRGEVRAIVLRGEGGHFYAAFGELCVAYASTGLATVAVVEGTCMGGGFGLACVADVALASDTAVFRLPETGLGVVPAQIAPFLVERLGYAEAKRLAVTGGKLDAQAALALRLVHGVHAGEALDAALASVLADILRCAPGAVAATKALIAKARFQSPASLVQQAAAVFSQAALGPEGTEGTTAFLQKRKPSWVPQ